MHYILKIVQENIQTELRQKVVVFISKLLLTTFSLGHNVGYHASGTFRDSFIKSELQIREHLTKNSSYCM